jgi:hypothetical protein
MTGTELVTTLRDDHETPFSRLGSSKALYALTGGEMNGETVRAAAADDANALADTLSAWADDEQNDAAATLFEDVADEASDRAASVAPSDYERGEDPDLSAELADLDETAARLGGLLARFLVSSKHVEQMVGFYIGDADPKAADDFRGLRSDLEATRERIVEALDETCESDADWDAARDAADAVVEAAYDDYVETLESMGVKPKNVC